MNTSSKKDSLTFNVLIIGDSGVGKTALLVRFCDDEYNPANISTVGIDCKSKSVKLEGKEVKIQLWDTAGQERYGKLSYTYYKKATGIILAYDVNDRKSFSNAKGWMEQIKTYANADVIKFLVGTKIDLSDRVVSINEGRKLAGANGMIFAETSAKEKYGVAETFEELVKEIQKNFIAKKEATEIEKNQSRQEGDNVEDLAMQGSGRIRLTTFKGKKEQKGCCN